MLSEQINQSRVFVQDKDGNFLKFDKAYEVNGRGGGLYIVVDTGEISRLNGEVEYLNDIIDELQEENKDLEDQLADQNNYDELVGADEDLSAAESALEDLESRFGFQTRARSPNCRIQEIADLIQELADKYEKSLQTLDKIKDLVNSSSHDDL